VRRPLLGILTVVLSVLSLGPAQAQDQPRAGGELIFLVPSEPPSYDGHKEGTFGTVQPLAPHDNTLLRVDPNDKTGTRPVADLVESWTVSPDGLTYTLKLRPGIRFHDGRVMTSAGLREAPPGRRGALHLHAAVASHHPGQRQGAWVDDHARALPEPAARYRVASRIDTPRRGT
jgi:extracellular solute-binding protein (family 5)